jgi:glyoxylase-like metal-dependent hydrolase (beta-lactamase superfamily II)
VERLHRVVGPVATNVHVLADPRSREAIAIDTATPSVAWVADELAARGWTLKLIVSTHGLWAPFEIVPSVPAVELAEGGEVRFGAIRLTVLHTPGHTEGSVCLYDGDQGLLYSGDTLFAGGWGRVDLPGGDAEAMAASIARLSGLEDRVEVFPGHGASTTIGRERAWLELVRDGGRLFA